MIRPSDWLTGGTPWLRLVRGLLGVGHELIDVAGSRVVLFKLIYTHVCLCSHMNERGDRTGTEVYWSMLE